MRTTAQKIRPAYLHPPETSTPLTRWIEAKRDAAGLADALLAIGKERMFLGDPSAAGQTLERAAAYAAQSGNHYVWREATRWLVVTFWELPIPADVAIGRTQQLLKAASSDPWAEAAIIHPLSVLYAYIGRFADARAAMAQYQAMFSGPLDMAIKATAAGEVELIAGNPAAAEQLLRQGCQALRAMGERGHLSSELGLLGEALYQQGRLAEAQQMTEEAEAVGIPDDFETQARWRAVRAKLLARQGDFPGALQLASEAMALVAVTSYAALQAQMLLDSAEVSRLAGAPREAEASLRQALRIYEDGRAVALAEQTRAALAALTARSGTGPA